jgi:hypothetical protein
VKYLSFSRRDVHGCNEPCKHTRKFLECDYFSVLILPPPPPQLCQLSPYFRGIHISIVSFSFLSILMNLSLRNIFFFCSFTVKFWAVCAVFLWITTPFCEGLRYRLFWRQKHGASKSIDENRGPKVLKGQPRSLSLGSKDAHMCRAGDIVELKRLLIEV